MCTIVLHDIQVGLINNTCWLLLEWRDMCVVEWWDMWSSNGRICGRRMVGYVCRRIPYYVTYRCTTVLRKTHVCVITSWRVSSSNSPPLWACLILEPRHYLSKLSGMFRGLLEKGRSANSPLSCLLLAAISLKASDQNVLSEFTKFKEFLQGCLLLNVQKRYDWSVKMRNKSGFSGLLRSILIFFSFFLQENKAFLMNDLDMHLYLDFKKQLIPTKLNMQRFYDIYPMILPHPCRILKNWVNGYQHGLSLC